jgi:NAD(P)-dependent dehydrogenase (short-subunit alcohol dehydrogenase family)
VVIRPEIEPRSGVIVTGANSGIGCATAVALAATGRPVSLWARNEPEVKQVAAEIARRFGVATDVQILDLRDRAAIDTAVPSAVAALGSVGGLVHSAGTHAVTQADGVAGDEWDEVLDVNLRAAARISRLLLPALRRSGPGPAIVFISSVHEFRGHGRIPAYCASKAGLGGLARSLAHGLAPDGIRVNCVCPGSILTKMLTGHLDQLPTLRSEIEASVALGRIGEPEEVAGLVRFLMSREASYITGQSIAVDGGMLACG